MRAPIARALALVATLGASVALAGDDTETPRRVAPGSTAPAPRAGTVTGWKLRVARTGLVSVALDSLPERSSSSRFILSCEGSLLPWWLADSKTLVFRADADPSCRDDRGRCYHLHTAAPGETPNGVATAPVATATIVFPEGRRAYDPLPAYDLASISSDGKAGGYWFHGSRLTFKAPVAGAATLRLSGIFVKQTRPPGNDIERLKRAGVKRDPGKVVVSKGGETLATIELGKSAPEGDDAELSVALAAGENVFELTAEPAGSVLVQRASLECALAPGEPEHVSAGEIEPCYRSDLLEKTGAEWLAIAPRALVAAVSPLAAHREASGLAAKVVALEDVEDAFADGTFGPEGIRAFLAHACESWTPRPRFVLLVGDAWRDARPSAAIGAVLPTALVDSFDNGATASDLALAPAGVAIGRFPVRTVAEASALVAKTIAYEKASSGAWQKQLAFVCGEGHFGEGADGMIETLFTQAVSRRVPDALDVDVTYGNASSIYFYPPDQFSDRVTERLSRGALIVNYVGHGAPGSFDSVYWGEKRYPIFRRADARKVACKDGHYPIVLITACHTGAFDEAERTVGEALVLNPEGAVAVFAASRESSPIANALLSLELTSRLFQQAGEVDAAARPRLGERLRAALDELSIKSGEDEGKMVVSYARMMGESDAFLTQLTRDERALYNLLGDPALVIRYASATKLEAPEDATAGTTIEVKAEGVTIERATLERRRQAPPGLHGLPEETSPDALTSPAVRKKIIETYTRANDFVVLKGKPEGSKARFVLPRGLKHGTYILKVYGGGTVASSHIEIDDADE